MEPSLFDKILHAASLAGALMLENGGEIYRVEAIMQNVARSYGAAHWDCYATPTSIMLTIYDGEERPYTVMKRVHERSTNLDKVEKVNRVSRGVAREDWPLARTLAALKEIEAEKPMPLPALVLASSVACAAFVALLGGNRNDVVCGLFTGALLRFVVQGISKLDLGFFFVNLTGGAVAALAGWLCSLLGFATNWDMLTIATSMLLVPGLLFTNAFRDIVAGDLISGISRVFETLAVAVALAGGAALAYAVLNLLAEVGI